MLLSRVADALYWIGRYLERAEHAARVVDVRLELGLDRFPHGSGWDFAPLYASLNLSEPDAASIPGNPAMLVDRMIFDLSNRESVMSCVIGARDNARQVREEISSEMWEQVNSLFLRLKEARAEGTWAARPHYLSRLVIEGVHLFQGITDATMGHGEGWQFLQVGRFLERADATAALIDVHFRRDSLADSVAASAASGGLREHTELAGLLQSCTALEAYCRVYTADLRPDRVAEFLLLNSEFPRSVRFSAACVESALRVIAQHAARPSAGRAERLAGRLHASLDYGQVDEILSDNPHRFLQGIGRQCQQIHTAIHQTYIAYPIESAIPA
jgi:uncharacterized alpha-E superfamily protein